MGMAVVSNVMKVTGFVVKENEVKMTEFVHVVKFVNFFKRIWW